MESNRRPARGLASLNGMNGMNGMNEPRNPFLLQENKGLLPSSDVLQQRDYA